MIAILRRRPLIAGLAVLALALAILLAFELGEGSKSQVAGGASRPAMPAPSKLLPSVAVTSADQAYPETVARPLFTPTRRPAPPQAVAAASAFNRGQFELLGVIIVGNAKTAMLREKASGKVHRVELGREVNGIKLASIDRDTVTLAQGGETEVVPMQVHKGTPGGPAALAASGPFGGAAPGQPPPAQPVPPGQQAQPHPPQPPIQIPPGTAAFLGIPPPGAAPAPGATAPSAAAPMSPEELLARRRSRRAQPNQ